MQFFQEITSLSAKLNLDQADSFDLENQNLDSETFDLNFFLEKNFTLDKENNLLNYLKLEECFPKIENLQKKICEEIAISVDSNLDKYIKMAEEFEDIKAPLQEFDDIFEKIKNNINLNRDESQKNLEEIEKIISSHEYLKIYAAELKCLKFCINSIRRISQTIESDNIDACTILNLSRLLKSNNKKFNLISYSKYDFIDSLMKKYNIKKIHEKLEEKVLLTFEKALQIILNDQGSLNRNEIEKLIALTQAFNLLGNSKKAEVIILEYFIKPNLKSCFECLLNKNSLIVASQREFILKNKNLPLKNFFEELKQVFEQKFLSLIELNNFKKHDDSEGFCFYEEKINFLKVIVEYILNTLGKKEYSYIFNVGIADIFYLNFLVAEQLSSFFKKFEIKSDFKAEVECLCEIFLQKWNTSTYFYLRSNDIIKNFEKGFYKLIIDIQAFLSNTNAKKPEIQSFFFDAITSCFRPGLYLNFLFSEFIRLALQLMIRFNFLIAKHISSSKEFKFFENLILFYANSLNVIYDTMEEKIKKIFAENNISNVNNEMAILMKNRLNDSILSLLLPIKQKLISQCLENLEPYNGLINRFRGENPGQPEKPSHLSNLLFKPLFSYIQNNHIESLANEYLKKEIFEKVISQYKEVSRDILDSAKKSESLQKFFDGQTKGKEYINIKQQLELDFNEIVEICEQKLNFVSNIKFLNEI